MSKPETTDKEIDLTWPWEKMHDAFFDPRTFVTIRSCRRSFKTLGAVRWLVEKLLDPDNPGQTAIWVDTVNKNIDRYYERCFLPLVKDVSKWNYQKKTLDRIEKYLNTPIVINQINSLYKCNSKIFVLTDSVFWEYENERLIKHNLTKQNKSYGNYKIP